MSSFFLALLLAFALAACAGRDQEANTNSNSVLIRTPHPTFTPTPPGQQASPQHQADAVQEPASLPSLGGAVAIGQSQAQEAQNQPQSNGAIAVVNAPLVNVRTGPSVDNDIVATVERGAELEIVGRNGDGSWWHVCCVGEQTAWIINDYVDTEGPVDAVPVTGGVSAQVRVVQSEPVPTSATDDFAFILATQEQFPETGLVRIFLYVLDGTSALPGYSLAVKKDGVDLPVDTKSFGGQPAFTWPFQDARQRHQNLKLEFPDIQAAGTWEIQLLNPSGNPDGPAATFNLAPDSPNQELYVRYERR